jgi:hypothetical protein
VETEDTKRAPAAPADDEPATAPAPWDRLPGETVKAFIAFCAYRDLGPTRTIPKAIAVIYGMPLSERPRRGKSARFELWSRRNSWVARAGAFDLAEQKQAEIRLAAARIDARTRRLAASRAMFGKAVKRLNKIDGERLSVEGMLRLLESAMKNERLDLGEATERTEGGAAVTTPVVIYLPENNRGRPEAHRPADGGRNGDGALAARAGVLAGEGGRGNGGDPSSREGEP